MQAIQVLVKEQNQINQALEIGSELIRQVKSGVSMQKELLRDLVAFLESYACRHYYSKIDEVVLPWIEDRLETRYPEISQWLEIEKDTAMAYLKRINASLDEDSNEETLAENLSSFQWLLRWQIDMHANVILSIAKRLGEEDDDHLLLQYDQVAPEGRHKRAEADRQLLVFTRKLNPALESQQTPAAFQQVV